MLDNDPLADPQRLIRSVYAYAAYRLGAGADAEDATSATFERALRYRVSYDRAHGEPLAWLIGIARRCIADVLEQRLDTTAVPVEAATAHSLEDDSVRRLDVAAAVATLDERDRELIALRYGADLTARQIATLLDVRTNAVEVALHRALNRLRAISEPEERVRDGRQPKIAADGVAPAGTA